jgi:uncharacterized membrane protein YozB (DUF420 family)
VGVPSTLATVNAALNGTAALCLTAGYLFIRRRKIVLHRACMTAAFTLSVLFLIGYVAHHATVGSVPFRGQGAIRTVYFVILIPHILLAAPVVPLALLTFYRGATGRFARHKAIARYTLPVWLFVSASGVLVYLLLYHW